VIDPREEPRSRAARVHLERKEPLLFARRARPAVPRHRSVHRTPIEARGSRDVLGPLQAPLNLDRCHAELDELRHESARLEILGRQQVGAIPQLLQHAVDHQLVRQPARLRARPPVRAPPSDGLARQALPRVRDAQGAVHEHLELRLRLRSDRRDVVERQLARQDHARRAERPRELHRPRVGTRHLRRRVDGQRGRDGLHQLRDPQVLHDHRVHGRFGAHADGRFHARKLIVEDECIQRDVPLRAALVERAERLLQRAVVEVRRACASVEGVEPEVHGIGTGGDGGAHGVGVACGSEHFRGAAGGARGHWGRWCSAFRRRCPPGAPRSALRVTSVRASGGRPLPSRGPPRAS